VKRLEESSISLTGVKGTELVVRYCDRVADVELSNGRTSCSCIPQYSNLNLDCVSQLHGTTVSEICDLSRVLLGVLCISATFCSSVWPMSSETVHTAPELSQWLRLIQAFSGGELGDLVSVLGLHERLPSGFLATLDDADLTICYRAAIICYGVTGSVQVPRKMQLKAVLSDYHGKDTLVSAGTGSGKTLPIALNVLLDDPDKDLITLTLSPLKRLQMTQESDFNS
jgi:hypothetical protein